MAATLYGHVLESDLLFERAREGHGPRGRLEIRRAERPIPRSQGRPVVTVDDRFVLCRDGQALSIWCKFSGSFTLDPTARTVCADASVPDGSALEHRLACLVVPLLLAERGDLALHASAVEAGGRGIAFAGHSGRGKSTIAWALGSRGHPVLAEDGCVVTGGTEGLRLWPGLAGVRLRDGGASPKVVGIGGTGPNPVALGAVVLLDERGGNAPVLERVPPVEALTAVMPNTIHAQGRSLAAAFRGAAELSRAVPVMRGSVPDGLAGAPAHSQRLLEMVLDAIAC